MSIETVDYAILEKSNLQKDMGLSEEWEKNTVHLMGAAENFNRRSAFVQCSTDESIQSYYRQHQLLIFIKSTDYKHKAQHHSKKQ